MKEQATLLLLRLILGHIIGDFILQPYSWVVERNKKHAKSKYLYFHCIIHTLLSIVALGIKLWWVTPIVFITHFIIDLWKSNRGKHEVRYFILDQFAHIAVLFLIVFIITGEPNKLAAYSWNNSSFLARLIAYIVATSPVSILIKNFTKEWKTDVQDEGLQRAGKWIGYIERILVISLIAAGQYQPVGYLLAAKSIFRIGDMRGADRNKTEYIVIGTMLSFGSAIIIGLLLNYYVL